VTAVCLCGCIYTLYFVMHRSLVTVACVMIWHVLTFLECNVLYVFSLVIYLIFLVARYLNVFYIFVSKFRIAFSISVISVLINCFGSLSIALSNLVFKVFICSHLSFICVKFTRHVWNVCFFVSLLWLLWDLCSWNVSSFY
jgi:hypothetical protein